MNRFSKCEKAVRKVIAYILLMFLGAFAFLIVLSAILSIQACQPRSATMCLNSANAWVKCPPNTSAGTILKAKK